ncbi:MAG: hypothetical protein K2X47_18880, partial [Bdellovibrionales bacterium]|nr:hypothetical protein [Bdellovibrionales bacterium]
VLAPALGEREKYPAPWGKDSVRVRNANIPIEQAALARLPASVLRSIENMGTLTWKVPYNEDLDWIEDFREIGLVVGQTADGKLLASSLFTDNEPDAISSALIREVIGRVYSAGENQLRSIHIYHTHPPKVTELSQGDLVSAQQFLAAAPSFIQAVEIIALPWSFSYQGKVTFKVTIPDPNGSGNILQQREMSKGRVMVRRVFSR